MMSETKVVLMVADDAAELLHIGARLQVLTENGVLFGGSVVCCGVGRGRRTCGVALRRVFE